MRIWSQEYINCSYNLKKMYRDVYYFSAKNKYWFVLYKKIDGFVQY